jgi:hypothetical protein
MMAKAAREASKNCRNRNVMECGLLIHPETVFYNDYKSSLNDKDKKGYSDLSYKFVSLHFR